MRWKYLHGLEDKFVESSCSIFPIGTFRDYQMLSERSLHHIVRRGAYNMLVPPADLEQMPVGHAREKAEIFPSEFLLKKSDKYISLRGRDLPCRMVLYDSILYRDQIASHGHLAISDRHAHARGFKGTPPLEHLGKAVSENGKVRNLAPRGEPLGNRIEKTAVSMSGEPVHFRFVRNLQRGFPPEYFQWLIGHSISQYYKVFHVFSNLLRIQKRPRIPGPSHFPADSIGYLLCLLCLQTLLPRLHLPLRRNL